MPSWSKKKNRCENFSRGFLHSDFLGGGVSPCAVTPLIVTLSPDHSDITRFRAWSPIATGNHLDRAEKVPKLVRRMAPLKFLIRVQVFRDPLRGELSHVQISWMMDPARSREMPSCSAIDLAEIRRSSRISSWIWSIIYGVVTVLGRPGRGASQVENSPRLNWTTKFLMVAYDGAYSPNVSVRMTCIPFGALPRRREKTWWQLVSWCCWNLARRLTCFLSVSVTRKDLQFGTWKRSLSPTTLSIPSYDIWK